MLRSVTIAGLGPYGSATRIELDPSARTDLVQPSASGKTTLITALSWALWNTTADGAKLPDALIHDGADECTVSLELKSGSTFTRSKRRNTSPKRSKNGADVATEREWTAAIGKLGQDPDLLRTIVCPLGWVGLAHGEGGGRPLRDLLAALLPSADLRAVVAELCSDLQTGDSVHEKEAFQRRAQANSAREQSRGRVSALEGQSAPDARTDQPSPAAAQDAALILAAAHAWEAWRPVAAWDARAAGLGPRPEPDPKAASRLEALQRAEAKHTDAASEVASLELPVAVDSGPRDEAMRARTAAEQRVRDLSARAGACPTCHRDWPEAAAMLAAAKAEAEAAAKTHDVAHRAFEAAQKKARDQRRAELDTAKGNVASAALAVGKARTSWEAAARNDEAGRWDAAHRALGDRPEGAQPTAPEPSVEAIAAARVTQDRLREAAGARRQAEEHRARLAADLRGARADLERHTAEASRLDRLVEAVRRAPSVVAERQLGALGGEVRDGRAVIGPMSIRFPSEGPAVEVLIDGRPFWTASRGRLVVADLALRMALRRARGLAWLPVIVDNAQDWSGELQTEGPAIVLRTAGPARQGVAP